MSDQVIVFVHGTFANHDSDNGELWWQIGSEFNGKLGAALDANAAGPFVFVPFHWSGLNDYVRRYEAGQQLYNQFSQWEEQGKKYHIICHSHGGTVLLHALEIGFIVESHKKYGFWGFGTKPETFTPLENLRTCLTIGTPFIHYFKPRLTRRPLAVLEIAIYLLVVIGLTALTVTLVSASGPWFWLTLLAVFPALAFLWFGLRGLKFVHIQHANPFLLKGYRTRFIALSHKLDEAINLLRSAKTSKLQSLRLPRAESTLDPTLIQERRLLIRLLFGWEELTASFYNWLLRPAANRIFRRMLLRRLYGVPFLKRIKEISHAPPFGEHVASPLGEEVSEEIEAIAQARLSAFPPILREQLQAAASGEANDPMRVIQESSGTLIHTAYFDSQALVGRLADEIARRQ